MRARYLVFATVLFLLIPPTNSFISNPSDLKPTIPQPQFSLGQEMLGVSSAQFLSMNGELFSENSYSSDYVFIDHDVIVLIDHPTTRTERVSSFKGTVLCSGGFDSETNPTGCFESELRLINVSSGTLIAEISGSCLEPSTKEGVLFVYDRCNTMLPDYTGSKEIQITWPNGTIWNTSTHNLISVDATGNLINTVRIQHGYGYMYGTVRLPEWPGHLTQGSSGVPRVYCHPIGEFVALNATDIYLLRSCVFSFHAGSEASYAFNFSNGLTNSSLDLAGPSSVNSGNERTVLVAQRLSNGTPVWDLALPYYTSDGAVPSSVPLNKNYGPEHWRTCAFSSTGKSSLVASDWHIALFGPRGIGGFVGVDGGDCAGRVRFGLLNGTLLTEAAPNSYTKMPYTLVQNSTTGALDWIAKIGGGGGDWYGKMHLALNQTTLSYCTLLSNQANGVFQFGSTTLTGGTMGILSVNVNDGTYINHFSSTLTNQACDSIVHQPDGTLLVSSHGNFGFKIERIDLSNSQRSTVFAMTGWGTKSVSSFNLSLRVISSDVTNANYGSGTIAGGDGIGVIELDIDRDGDFIPDVTDLDDDGDGVPDVQDNCPQGMLNWEQTITTDPDQDGCHFQEDSDGDNDGINDVNDDCNSPANSYESSPQSDFDGDGCRDATEDDDDDNDGVLDVDDGCLTPSDIQRTNSNDLDGDGCVDTSEDADDDNDGIPDSDDECASVPNSFISTESSDHDSDGCRDSTEDSDDDADGVLDSVDNCPRGRIAWERNLSTDIDGDGCEDLLEDSDDDSDGVPDLIDACPKLYGTSSFGSAPGCPDSDEDGFGDAIDACPQTFGLSHADRYGCPDGDNDGTSDFNDAFPDNSTRATDSDLDGVADEDDAFPFLAGQSEDSDGDGFGDNPTGPSPDACANLSGNSSRGLLGCPDSDGDGYANLEDWFPFDPLRWKDTDQDGVSDQDDHFPVDFTQWLDTDGDGYGDNLAGRQPDMFPFDATQWTDADGDGLGDNQNGQNPDPYLDDFDNDGYNDSIDPLPKYASPGDLDNDGTPDVADAFPADFREWADADGDGEGDNADPDDDNDGWSDADEVRQGTDPFSSSSQPIDGFEVIIPGTQVSLGAWDLIGIFGGVPVFIWIAIGFATRNGRTARYEEMLRGAESVDDLEQISGMWEYSLMMRMLGPHQGIRLERLRADLEYEFLDHRRTSTLVDEYDQTEQVEKSLPGLEQAVAHEPTETEQPIQAAQAVAISTNAPTADTAAQRSDENGYEWFTLDDGTNFYRTEGSGAEWVKFEN